MPQPLVFERLTLDHIETLKPWFGDPPHRFCDFTLGGTFMWRDLFAYAFAIDDVHLYFRMRVHDDTVAYALPLGPDRMSGLVRLYEHTRATGEPLVLALVGPDERTAIDELWPQATWVAERDFFDYVYDAQDLIDLVGRAHKSTRNHISKFQRLYPNHAFTQIDQAGVEPAHAFIESYLKQVVANKDYPSLLEERMKVLEVLDALDRYGMVGGVLTVGDEIVGLSLGEAVGDTLYVHTEKALTDFPGAYQRLMHAFVTTFASDPSVRYVNREDDNGDEGLRRSKLSYNPCRILEKYTVYVDARA